MSGSVLATGGYGRLARQVKQAGGERVAALARANLDITDGDSIRAALARLQPSLVINAAVVSSVETSAAETERAFAVNAAGPGLLAEACREVGIPLIHLSTDYVFGAPTTRPWREDDPVSSVNAYGQMKAEGERRVLASGARACVVRVAWLFGDRADFPTQMIRLGLEQGSVRVAQDQVGSPTPLGPLAGLLLRLGERMLEAPDGIPPILHMAGSPPVARADWVQAAFDGLEESGRAPPRLIRTPLASFPSAAARPNYSALDTTRLATLFGETLDWRDAARAIGRSYSAATA